MQLSMVKPALNVVLLFMLPLAGSLSLHTQTTML